VPGVESAAVTSVIPLNRNFRMTGVFEIVGRKATSLETIPQVDLRFSSPRYPKTLGIRLEKGRFFDARMDTPSSQPVVVVNQTFVDRYLRGQDPLKQRLMVDEKGKWAAAPIVGVLSDVREIAVNRPAGPEVHLSTTQLEPGL